jgi:hypothetical protein
MDSLLRALIGGSPSCLLQLQEAQLACTPNLKGVISEVQQIPLLNESEFAKSIVI